jgi:hypothetical protein
VVKFYRGLQLDGGNNIASYDFLQEFKVLLELRFLGEQRDGRSRIGCSSKEKKLSVPS